MSVDQDWPSVWPAAATYKASVVPLPVRMGTRKYPEKRAPFKRFGNLELLKIPNFLHLTPEHVKRHCEAIKSWFPFITQLMLFILEFCTPFPKELVEKPELADQYFPVRVKYSDYLHQGTSLRDIRARVNTIEAKLKSFGFDKHAEDKFRHLAGNRYNEENDTLTIVTDRCYTRKQNREYADFLLTALYFESNKIEAWEEMKQREDNLKVEFEGSRTEKRIIDLVEKLTKAEQPVLPVAESLKGKEFKKEEILQHPTVKNFAETWYEYRNTVSGISEDLIYQIFLERDSGIHKDVRKPCSRIAGYSETFIINGCSETGLDCCCYISI